MNSKCIFEVMRQIISCRMIGTFSTRDAKDLYKHFRDIVGDMTEPFGILMDIKGFEGSTPEGFAEAEVFNQWLANTEIVAKVNLITKGVIEKIVEQRIPTRHNYQLEVFDTEQDAIEHLKQVLKKEKVDS